MLSHFSLTLSQTHTHTQTNSLLPSGCSPMEVLLNKIAFKKDFSVWLAMEKEMSREKNVIEKERLKPQIIVTGLSLCLSLIFLLPIFFSSTFFPVFILSLIVHTHLPKHTHEFRSIQDGNDFLTPAPLTRSILSILDSMVDEAQTCKHTLSRMRTQTHARV